MKQLKEWSQWLCCLLVISVLARLACLFLAPDNPAGIVAQMLTAVFFLALAGLSLARLVLWFLGRR